MGRGWVSTALAVLAVTALGACGEAEESPRAEPTTCAAPGDVPAPEELTERIDLGEAVGWSDVRAERNAVNAAGIAPDTDLAALLTQVQEAVDAAGWDPLSLDDEGFEAELLARDDAGGLLAVTLREATCPGQVLVAVSITDYEAS